MHVTQRTFFTFSSGLVKARSLTEAAKLYGQAYRVKLLNFSELYSEYVIVAINPDRNTIYCQFGFDEQNVRTLMRHHDPLAMPLAVMRYTDDWSLNMMIGFPFSHDDYHYWWSLNR